MKVHLNLSVGSWVELHHNIRIGCLPHEKGPDRVKFISTLFFILCLGVFTESAYSAKVLATVNGKKITDSDVKKALSGFNEGQKSKIFRDMNSRRQVVSNLVDQEILLQEAQKLQLENSKEFRAAYDAFRKQYLANLLVSKKLGSKLNEKAAKDYYKKNKHIFTTEQARLHHILLDKQREAEQIMKKAKAKGADFQALAEKYSKDPSAKYNRGDIGFVTRDRIAKEISAAAFRAKEGDIVGPIKTAYGYHIVKVIKRTSGKLLSYNEVQLQVKNVLREELVRSYVAGLKRKAKITYNLK